MPKLYLTYNDENRVRRRVTVADSKFTIGRGAENDLTFANQNLSRFHAKIECLGDIFVLSDNDSSNGTQLNDNNLTTSIALSDGDKITFGGAVNVKVEISENAANVDFVDDFDVRESNSGSISNAAAFSDAPKVENKSNAAKSEFVANQTTSNQSSRNLIWLAPIGGIFVLLVAAILYFLLSGDGSTTKKTRKTDVASETNSARRTKTTEDSTANDNDNKSSTTSTMTNDAQNISDNQSSSSNIASNSGQTNNSNGDAMPVNSGNNELDAVAENSQKFLRNISRESNPILTQKQTALINAKIKVFKNSAALRDNLKNAAKNNAQFQSIANANGLKPQFLSIFALTKLGDSRGETFATASAALPNLKRLSEVLGSELANDCLLVTGANAEGVAPNEMRDRLTSLAKQTPNASPSTIRSIWFLREKGKLSEPAFDFILRFIAIGAIAQNPKAFGVDADNLN